MHHRLFMGYGGAPAFLVDAANFDGTNDFMLATGITAPANAKTGIFSCWFRVGATPTLPHVLLTNAPWGDNSGLGIAVVLEGSVDDKIHIYGYDPPDGVNLVLDMQTNSTFASSGTWRHILASWDLAAGVTHLYIDDASDKTTNTATDSNIIYNTGRWTVGEDDSVNSFKWNGDIAELYFAPGQYLDFSVASNRRKFRTSGGKPVDLGSTGSTPTGSAPLIYLHLNDGEAVANFATNDAGNGNFSITGTLATSSTSPSD